MAAMVEDLPIALRRTRRSSAVLHSHPQEAQRPKSPTVSTPSRGAKKRVRFSDPGPSSDHDAHVDDEHLSASTGLTPHIRRTTLEPGSGTKRRRHSGPVSQDRPVVFDSTIDTRHSGEVTFLPLRQVLDGRVKRRIRRNGLSEEINIITAERRKKAQQTSEEIAALRSEVAAKDAEIRRLSGATAVGQEEDEETQESIDELKRQVSQLRRVLKSPDSSNETEDTIDYNTTRVDWAMQVRDPFSSEYSDMELDADDDDDDEDHHFGDKTMAELACSTPSRRSSNIRNSFPTPPSTSPHLGPITPSRRHPVTPTSQAAVQTSFAAADREELEDELASLQLEIAKLTGTLETYESMTSRLSEKLSPWAPKDGSATALIMDSRSPAVRVEAQLNNLLQALSDRTAALEGLDASLGELGFPGGDASEVVLSLSSAFRTARLELEYLTPGEIALPLTAAGAAVLDLLLTRLRELAKRTLECEDAIDEYHVLELSLRKQLGARAEAMDAAKAERDALAGEAGKKDARIRELEVGVQRLKGAVKSYTRDVSELEGLVQRLEGDLDTANKDLRAAREQNEADAEERADAAREKDFAAAMLEEKLGLALEQTSELKDQLEELRARHREDVFSMSQRHGVDLVMRDSRVSELRLEVDRVNEALREAHETVQNLRVENGALSDRLDSEKAKAKAAIDTMKNELERVVRMGQDLMATPRKNPGRGSRPH
ncbi:hypothetical protein INS49_003874 [Diaporthe citri]|uniref:uncharacterized protein n=1 Tax=Diaporthe citri TaxID=83186 RepID=UPI001C7F0109|nr:uncharacterized protein INS49_003874 [Diaporthe citri]KAG6354793.1 hypothetical protein INS49_003874 [Diaporthe citri]